ncbi:MAG: hypothetical protein RLP09_47240 [Sandaracinaceae bacterium]
MDDDNIFDREQRFEIFVPSPKARINMGKPNLTSNDEGPFGYTGLSLQSDVHLFIDANKHTLFQTGQNYCGQVGGKWLQYSNADMIMSSTASVNLSADKKIVIASGAGQGQITAKDHGTFPRMVSYNALELHYRVDRIQTGLYEFFHGRREHDERSALAKFGGVDDPYFDRDGKAKNETAIHAKTKGGFLEVSSASLRELVPPTAGKERATKDFGKDIHADGDPVEWLDAPFLKKVAGKPDLDALKYGFSGYFQRFDPYGLINADALPSLIPKGIANFRNLMARMRRFADVTLKYAMLLTDNFLVKRVTALMGAMDNLLKATWHAYHFTEIFGFWGNPANRMDTALVDERASGWDARLGNKPMADETPGATTITGAAQAEITTGNGPWDVSTQPADFWEITVATESPARSQSFTLQSLHELATAPGPAVLALTVAESAKLLPKLRATLTGAALPTGVTTAVIEAWIGEVLGVAVSSGDADLPDGLVATPPVAVTRAYVDDPVAFVAATKQVAGHDLTLSDYVTIARVEQSHDVVFSVAGASVPVTLASATVAPNASAESLASLVRSVVESAVGTGGVVTPLASAAFELRTHGVGSSQTISITSGDAAVLTALGLTATSAAAGEDGASGATYTATGLTAAELAGLLGSVEGLEASTASAAVKLKSAHTATVAERAHVEASGTLADLVFGANPKSDTRTATETTGASSAASGEDNYKQLISWNHELQKLPEDTRNLTRPITNAVQDVVATMGALEAALESVVDVLPASATKGLPQPKETIGLIAQDGISLGTQDRIVGAGGKGVVFIADGGTGTEDHAKFTAVIENPVNVALAFDPIDRKWSEMSKAPDDPDENKPPSLGFRVYSDSVADLYGTYSAQLLALGRGKLDTVTPDGKPYAGVGTARVMGSHAVEIAGYRRVVIDARNLGNGLNDGGRVDVLGQTIFVGGFNKGAAATDMKDFVSDAKAGAGLEPLDMHSLAGAEFLSKDARLSLSKSVKNLGWTKKLREEHAPTNFVRIHAAKETTTVVGGFMLHVAHDTGFSLGTRKDDKDPANNVLDETKSHLTVGADFLELRSKQDKSFLRLEEKSAKLQFADDAGPKVVLAKSAARVDFDKTNTYLKLDRSRALLKHKSTVVSLKADGCKIEGSALTFKGQQVKIG